MDLYICLAQSGPECPGHLSLCGFSLDHIRAALQGRGSHQFPHSPSLSGDTPVPLRLLSGPHPGRAARSLSAPKPSHAPRHSQGADGAHSAARCVCRGGEPGEEGDESGLHNVLPVQQYSFFAITSVSSHVPPAATQADPSRPPFYVTGSGGVAMLFLGTPRCANLDELQVWTDGWMRCIFTLAEIVAHPPAGSLCTTSLCATSLLRKEVPSPCSLFPQSVACFYCPRVI